MFGGWSSYHKGAAFHGGKGRHGEVLGGYNLSWFKNFALGRASYANCRFCDMEPETPEHLLIDCRRSVKVLESMFPNKDHIATLATCSILEVINVVMAEERAQ